MTSPFPYYYGQEAEQFLFYRIPKLLVTGKHFRQLSTDAKLLYGLMLDRMGLSARNGWFDGRGRVYIYYTLDEIQESLDCGHDKAVKLLAELDDAKGIGLIERVKQGQGKPTKIYVKKFTTPAVPTPPDSSAPDFGKTEVLASKKQKSSIPLFRSAECGKTDANYTEINQTELSYIHPSIHPSCGTVGWMDRTDCRATVREQIGYARLCRRHDPEAVDELVELMTDVLCTSRPTLRIGGDSIPVQEVQRRFRQLNEEHIGYIFECLQRTTGQINNIRAYLLTSLYYAPTTILHHYQAEVQHDLGP